MLAATDGLGAFGTFLLMSVGLVAGARLLLRGSEGPPTVVEDGFTARGGGWVDGKRATSPFVELHVTPELIEIRPRKIESFAPVVITRADRVTISTVRSPLGPGLRFDGPRLGRRTTFWPMQHGAVVEAMRQLAWPVDEPAPAGEEPTPPAPPQLADHRIRYRCSPVVWLQLPVAALIGWIVISMGFPFLVPALLLTFFVVIIGTTAYALECDGVTFTCVALLWRRRVPVEDVLTIQGIPGPLLATAGKTTVTPRTGSRSWLMVATRRDRENFDWFLDELETMAPSITIRR